MKLEDIHALWDVDSVIDRTDLVNQSLLTVSLHSKYLRILSHEKMLLLKIDADLKRLKLDKYEFYTQGPTRETQKLGWKMPDRGAVLKGMAQQYMEADSDIVALALKVGLQQEKVSVLESIIRMINNRGFQIKNAIDVLKFEAGGH